MKKIVTLLLFILFLFKRSVIIDAVYNSILIWSKTLYPVLFPTFILSDLILSSGILDFITNKFGNIISKIFKTNKYALYVLLISFLCGTPTNAKVLKRLYDEYLIDENDINKILSMTTFFNPFFLISFITLKEIFLIWLSILISSFILRNNYKTNTENKITNKTIHFNLNESISNNLNILLNILGTISIFNIFSNLININNGNVKILLSGLLEITTALNKIKFYNDISKIIPIIIIIFGGISIFIQIKSILKDTYIDIKYFIKVKLLAVLLFPICTYGSTII